jgi:hypothetical protein
MSKAAGRGQMLVLVGVVMVQIIMNWSCLQMISGFTRFTPHESRSINIHRPRLPRFILKSLSRPTLHILI